MGSFTDDISSSLPPPLLLFGKLFESCALWIGKLGGVEEVGGTWLDWGDKQSERGSRMVNKTTRNGTRRREKERSSRRGDVRKREGLHEWPVNYASYTRGYRVWWALISARRPFSFLGPPGCLRGTAFRLVFNKLPGVHYSHANTERKRERGEAR